MNDDLSHSDLVLLEVLDPRLQYSTRDHKASLYFGTIDIAVRFPGLAEVDFLRPSLGMETSTPPSRSRTPLPQGYRQGIITAITVLLGFTLAFLRFWGFEAEGEWGYKSVTAAVGFTLALLLQVMALVRSLRVEDDDVVEYRVTVRLFVASAVVLVANLIIAAAIYSGVL